MMPTDLILDVHSNTATTPKKSLDSRFAKIDWHAPWLCHLSQLSGISQTITQLSATDKGATLDRTEHLDIIADILNSAIKKQSNDSKMPQPTIKPAAYNDTHALKFVSQNALPEGVGYEHFIGTTGRIPTRNNLHDLFNGSIWLTFPKTKAVLNYYHMLKLATDTQEHNTGATRGRVRDTITVFDENGAVLVTSNPSIGDALTCFDWQGSLIETRHHWDDPTQPNADAQAAVYIFGHALLEQLITPRKPLCAHSVIIQVSQDFFVLSMSERMTLLDDKLARYMHELLSNEAVSPRYLSPLPILGVPRFWAENSDPCFYNDSYVFRSGRLRQK
ncbi:DUF3025 domain-containing protein [Psychrobacter sp. DM4]|uniref:DUF3025 domain-containing protein n=1 Tax=Psychrobacter sp. DM4 TaxID=3440637 RepID=UPI003F50017F